MPRRDYDYDPNGNRTQLTAATITAYGYTPNSNRLTDIGGVPVTLDATGNLASQGSRHYEFDVLNRLVRADDDGVERGGYTYNGLAQRVMKQAGGQTTTFRYGLHGELLVAVTHCLAL